MMSESAENTPQTPANDEAEEEARYMARFSQQQDRPMSLGMKLNYFMENFSASQPNAWFHIFTAAVVVSTAILGKLWMLAVSNAPEEDAAGPGYLYSCYLMFQIIAAGGMDDSLEEAWPILVSLSALLFGFIVFAVLVGMVTEAFAAMVLSFNSGRSEVPEKNHTLVLGWNETTPRVICQIAFLRRAWRVQNESFGRKYCCLCVRRVEPSSPVARHKVVVLCNTKTKAEMHDIITEHFLTRGICPQRTKVGWDVVCRVGDPTKVMDLRLAGAQRAMSIVTQLTEADEAEEGIQQNCLQNGRTFTCLLALRHVLFTAAQSPPWHNLRIVVQLHRPSDTITAANWNLPDGRPAVLVQDLSLFMNSLLFSCIAHPGLGAVLNDLLGFEGATLRLTAVKALPNGGRDVVGKKVGEIEFAFMDAVLAGVVPERGMKFQEVDPWNGFACFAQRTIKENDSLIFVSTKAMPALASGITPEPLKESKPATSYDCERDAVRLLVCGWRPEWNKPSRFGRRVELICQGLPANSSITFLNLRTRSDFASDMEQVIDSGNHAIQKKELGRSVEYSYQGTVSFSHWEGDACKTDQLTGLLRAKAFDVAVVLSTIAGFDMPAESRDARVMAIALSLRHLQRELNMEHPIRIITENALDSTEELTLAPRGSSGSWPMPDFVNVHMIYARALVQSMAFPRLQPATRQLFASLPGGPEVALRPADCYIPLGVDLKFAAVKAQVRNVQKDTVCIGFRTCHGGIELSPLLTDSHVYEPGDRLVVITRIALQVAPVANAVEANIEPVTTVVGV